MSQASPGKLQRSLEWFFKNWHNVATAVGAIILIIATWITDPKAGPLFFIAIVLSIISSIRSFTLKPSYTELLKLAEEYEESLGDHQAALKGVLETALRALADELGIWNADTRMSCYTHNGNAFVMLARLSDNPLHARAGRAVYPEHEGVIGHAWRYGSKVQVDLPINDDRSYREKLATEYDMHGPIIDKLTMKSASLIAVRITDLRTEKHIGVVVLESTRARGVTSRVYNQLIDSNSWRTFQTLMSTSADMLPDMSDAKEEGF